MSPYGYVPKTRKAPWMDTPAGRREAEIAANRRKMRLGEQRQRKLWKRDRREKVAHKRTRARIRSVSKRKQKTTAEYRIAARAFVRAARNRGETCPVFAKYSQLPEKCQKFLQWGKDPRTGKPRLRSNRLKDVHHYRGRAGSLLTDQRFWIALSRWGHRLVHAFQDVARSHGWLCAKGEWNNPVPPSLSSERQS